MIVWALETLVASTLLMLLVLAVRAPVRRAFGPTIAYALWAIPAARMILPPLPDSWHEGTVAPLAQASETLVTYVVEPLGVPTDEVLASGPGLWPWLLAAWALGAIGFIGYHTIAHGRFCARVRRLASRTEMVASGNVEVIETDAATGPLAFGIWRKYVAFPRDFAERYDPLERDLALAHELGHHARGDLIANWAALVMLALHWFNPVAWRAYRAFRADQEMACDALVLAGRVRELRAAYGRAIVKSAHGGAVSAACHLHTINEIKGRLKMLSKHENTSRGRAFAGVGASTVLLVGSLALTASGTQAAETVRAGMETAVGVDLASLELPSLPQAEPLPSLAPPAAAGAEDASRITTVTTRTADGKTGRNLRVIVVGKDGEHNVLTDRDSLAKALNAHTAHGVDGKTAALQSPPQPPMPPEVAEDIRSVRIQLRNMPQISSRSCDDDEGKGRENVIVRKDGEKPITIICTNRIERVASLAVRDGERARQQSVVMRRFSEVSALEGLRRARRSVEANPDMTDARRAAALSGIDQAIREMDARKTD